MTHIDCQKQINYLKEQFLEDSLDDETKISMLDLLSEYDHEGIAAIKDLISSPLLQNQKIKKYALKIIQQGKIKL